MALAREATTKTIGYKVGDWKIAHYAISYTANAITQPANDPGFYLLNGCVLSQTTYPILFAHYGTSFNTGGEGAGNFRLPDLTEGKIPMGKGLTNFTVYAANGGEINHVLTTTEMPAHAHGNTLGFAAGSHAHSASSSTDSPGDHTHQPPTSQGNATSSGGQNTTITASASQATATTGNAGSHSHSASASIAAATTSVSLTGSVSNAGSGGSHNNMQPYIVVGGWLVKFG